MTSLIVNGLEDFAKYAQRLPDIATQAATYAINDVAGGTGLSLLRREMYSEVNFPNGYLGTDRLNLAKRATTSNLEAVIKGRDRPTSLARFIRGRAARGNPVSVMVKPGQSRELPGAWLVELNNGNTGLAVRLKPGSKLNKNKPASVRLAPDVYLLYGPSVDQVLAGVADDNAGKIGELLGSEFIRQVERLTRG